jgi:hypothetical protein
MVVFGRETLASSSCEMTGAFSAKTGFGGVSLTWARAMAGASATKTVSIPMRCRATANVARKGPERARAVFDEIILAEPFIKQ